MNVNKEKNIIISSLVIIFLIILVLSHSQTKLDNQIKKQKELIQQIKIEAQTQDINQYIQQTKWIAESYKNGIGQKINENNIKILKEKGGNPVYRSHKKLEKTTNYLEKTAVIIPRTIVILTMIALTLAFFGLRNSYARLMH